MSKDNVSNIIECLRNIHGEYEMGISIYEQDNMYYGVISILTNRKPVHQYKTIVSSTPLKVIPAVNGFFILGKDLSSSETTIDNAVNMVMVKMINGKDVCLGIVADGIEVSLTGDDYKAYTVGTGAVAVTNDKVRWHILTFNWDLMQCHVTTLDKSTKA